MARRKTAEERDEEAQERAQGPAPRPPRVAPGFVHAEHPETGEKVTFIRGEALPDWVKLPKEPEVDVT